MTSTTSWLQTKDCANLNLVFAIEGFPTLWCVGDAAGALTAWAGTGFSAAVTGLNIVGEMSQSVDLFDPKLDAGTLKFELMDTEAGTLASGLLRLASSADKKTHLLADLNNSAASFSVSDQAAFSTTGAAYIDHERISYTGTTTSGANTLSFTGVTRGVAALWQTESDRDFAPGHFVETDNVPAGWGTAPPVTDNPRTWYNRPVALYLHHYENGAWSTKANSRCLWAGRIKSWSQRGDGTLELTAQHIFERLEQPILNRQWSAELAQGIYVRPEDTPIVVWGRYGSTNFDASAQMTISNACYTWQEVLSEVNRVIATFCTADISIAQDMDWWYSNTPGFIGFSVKSSTVTFTDQDTFNIALSQDLWSLLGEHIFYRRGPVSVEHAASGYILHGYPMTRVPAGKFIACCCQPPIKYVATRGYDRTAVVSNIRGTWQTQTDMAGLWGGGVNSAVTGIVRGGGELWAVNVSGYDVTFYNSQGAKEPVFGVVREGAEYEDPPPLKQVWHEFGVPAGTALLKLMLSTGTSGYNSTTYDVYPSGIGLGIPYDLVDVNAFDAIDADAPYWSFALEAPTKFSTLFLEVLGATNRYPVWSNGKISCRRMPVDHAYASGAHNLTNDNKAQLDDRTRIAYGVDGVINKASIKYKRDLVSGNLQAMHTVVLGASASAYGVHPITAEAGGFQSPAPWLSTVVPALAHFQQPPAIIERTYNASLIGLEPTDFVLLDDPLLIDPKAGTRGVTDLPAVCLGTSFDWRTGVGQARLAFLPNFDVDYSCLWAPSARVDDTGTSGGYVTGTKVLTCKAHQYGDSTADADAEQFPVGSKVRVVEVDGATSDVALAWADTVAAQNGNTITLTTGLTAPTWLTERHYVVISDDIGTVIDAQKGGYAFLANAATDSTGDAAHDTRLYGIDRDADTIAASRTYTDEYCRGYSTEIGVGEPYSAHQVVDLVNAGNNHLGYVSRTMFTFQLGADDYVPPDTDGWMTFIAPVPVYGDPNRPWLVKINGYNNSSGTITFTVGTSDAWPRGYTYTNTYPANGYNSATITINSTSATWSAAAEIKPFYTWDTSPPFTWLWVMCIADEENAAYFRGISVAEAALA